MDISGCRGWRKNIIRVILEQEQYMTRRLSFKGLGEPITFVTFGPLAVGAFYLAHVRFSRSIPMIACLTLQVQLLLLEKSIVLHNML